MKVYIVDKSNPKNISAPNGGKQYVQEELYVVLSETDKIQNGKKMYEIRTLKGAEVVEYASTAGVETVNFLVENGMVKNKDASLSRFRQKGFRVTPVTVLAELHDNNGGLVGYRYSSSNGTVFMRKTEDFLSDCEQLMAKAWETRTAEAQDVFKPIQNMKYFPAVSGAKAYVSIYLETNPLPVEVIVTKAKNKYANTEAPKIEENAKNVAKTEKRESIFTKEQLRELAQADANKVDIKIIGNPKLSPEQMHSIWTVEALGFPARKYAFPEYPVEFMDFLGLMLRTNVDISTVLTPKYDKSQALEILAGIAEGLDVSEYADPSNSAEEMKSMRRDLYHNIWEAGLFTGGNNKLRRVAKQM